MKTQGESAGDRAWFCGTPEGNKGPFNRGQMADLLRRRVIGKDSFVWREGFESWVTVEKCGDFHDLLSPQAAPPHPVSGQVPSAGKAQDDYLDGVFTSMVQESWKRHNRRLRAMEVDEVLVGAVITATLDNGYALIDLESDGVHHALRFEETSTGNRILFNLTHKAESLVTSSVLGHEADVRIGYGERVQNFQQVWGAIKQEMKSMYIAQADPGVITIDGDISSQYVYVEVGLLWDLNEYLHPDDPYRVNYPKLTQNIGATIHALRKYLRGRFQSS